MSAPITAPTTAPTQNNSVNGSKNGNTSSRTISYRNISSYSSHRNSSNCGSSVESQIIVLSEGLIFNQLIVQYDGCVASKGGRGLAETTVGLALLVRERGINFLSDQPPNNNSETTNGKLSTRRSMDGS